TGGAIRCTARFCVWKSVNGSPEKRRTSADSPFRYSLMAMATSPARYSGKVRWITWGASLPPRCARTRPLSVCRRMGSIYCVLNAKHVRYASRMTTLFLIEALTYFGELADREDDQPNCEGEDNGDPFAIAFTPH